MSNVSKLILAVIVVAVGIGGVLLWHGHESSSPSASPSATATASPSPTSYAVKVYFSRHPESDNDPSKTFAVNRTSPDQGVGRYAVSQLLAGPTAKEAATGLFTPGLAMSGNSTCGGQDFTLNTASGKATLQFCRATALTGVMADGQLESELKATLLQFPSVQKVIILNQAGDCLFNASGLNLCKQ